MASPRVSFVNYKNKEILFLNFAACTADEILHVIEESKEVIRTRPQGSLLTLSDVTNARFNEQVTQQMKEFTAHNKPYVRAAAVVGIVGLKKILLEAVMMFSKRKLHAFDTLDQAKDWLVSQ